MQKKIFILIVGLLTSTAAFSQSLNCTAALSTSQRIACEKLNYLELSSDGDTGRVAVDLLDVQLAAVQIRLEQSALDFDHVGSFILNEVGVHLGEVKELLLSLNDPRVDLDSVFKNVQSQIEGLRSVYRGEL